MKSNYPFLSELHIRGQIVTASLTAIALVPLLLSIGRSPTVKFLASSCAATLAVSAGLVRRNTKEVRSQLDEHVGIAGVQRTRDLGNSYKPETNPRKQIKEEILSQLNKGKTQRDIILSWGDGADAYPDGLALWRMLGLPEEEDDPRQ